MPRGGRGRGGRSSTGGYKREARGGAERERRSRDRQDGGHRQRGRSRPREQYRKKNANTGDKKKAIDEKHTAPSNVPSDGVLTPPPQPPFIEGPSGRKRRGNGFNWRVHLDGDAGMAWPGGGCGNN